MMIDMQEIVNAVSGLKHRLMNVSRHRLPACWDTTQF